MKKVLYYGALAVCIGVFCVSGGTLVKRLMETGENNRQQESLAALMSEPAQEAAAETVSGEPGETYEQVRLANTVSVGKLQELNSDVAGWISIPDTRINYPVMHTPEDGSFYLKRDFNKEYSRHGTPFLDGECDLDSEYQNLMIYGHHMNDGSMFGGLEGYNDKEFLESHPMIHFDTAKEYGDYQIIAVFKRSAVNVEEEFLEYIHADTPERNEKFLKYVEENRLYDTGIEAEFGERLLTMMTCEYSQKNGRLFVVAKKVKSEKAE